MHIYALKCINKVSNLIHTRPNLLRHSTQKVKVCRQRKYNTFLQQITPICQTFISDACKLTILCVNQFRNLTLAKHVYFKFVRFGVYFNVRISKIAKLETFLIPANNMNFVLYISILKCASVPNCILTVVFQLFKTVNLLLTACSKF